jgi:FKBP-type peptidyl-prolyl cis-trans isomerase (trigger factor)
VEIDGFRKGHAPENMITAKYGEMIIMEEMANLAINETYLSNILKENENRVDNDKVFPIDQPKIIITKLGKGSEFEYTATFAVLPKVSLPDYKKISKAEIENVLNSDEGKRDAESVTDKDVEEVLQNLAKARTPHSHMHADGTVHHESHDHTDDTENNLENKEEDVKLDDTFAQSFGPDFKSIEDLRNKVKENLKLEKESKMIERKRTAILEKLLLESTCDVPEILITSETEKMLAQMRGDIEKFGSN